MIDLKKKEIYEEEDNHEEEVRERKMMFKQRYQNIHKTYELVQTINQNLHTFSAERLDLEEHYQEEIVKDRLQIDVKEKEKDFTIYVEGLI